MMRVIYAHLCSVSLMMIATYEPFVSYAECRYAECHYAKCCYAKCRYAECHYAKCCYAKCRYAECHYADCHYAECRGAKNIAELKTAFQKFCSTVPRYPFVFFIFISASKKKSFFLLFLPLNRC